MTELDPQRTGCRVPPDVDAIAVALDRLAILIPALEPPDWVGETAASDAARRDALVGALAEPVARLLAGNRSQLAQLLYAVDVREAAVDARLAEVAVDQAGWAIAAMLVDRLCAAAGSAYRYRVSDPDDEFS